MQGENPFLSLFFRYLPTKAIPPTTYSIFIFRWVLFVSLIRSVVSEHVKPCVDSGCINSSFFLVFLMWAWELHGLDQMCSKPLLQRAKCSLNHSAANFLR